MPSTTLTQTALLVVSVSLIVVGICLTIAGAFSPAWQVVEIREFLVEHQHGLWWDCVREERHVVAVGDFYDETPLHCMYKFDDSAELVIKSILEDERWGDGAAWEAQLHEFSIWHKAILFFIVFSELLASISICCGVSAPCFRGTTFAFAIALFAAMLCSIIADGLFFLTANRVDHRFAQGMVGTYEQQIGYAFYLHLFGTLSWIFAFGVALFTTYKFMSGDRYEDESIQFEHQDPLLDKPRMHQGDPSRWNRQDFARPATFTPPTRMYRETTA
ncbi:CLaudin-like in Caenorhabditis [Aphelenchoides besseyi]|nr:CLaudin-like in Caenorhabditis [Aphelenchoides besseyi]KAI6207391.1 CLaudin-like in Caenorhabditis [Aphelenchoides besseyi]